MSRITPTSAGNCEVGLFQGMDFLPLGILACDRNFCLIFWNTCLESWTGLSREELLGKDIREVFPQMARPLVVDRLAALFHGGPPAVFSYHLHKHLIPALLPDGSHRMQHSVAFGMKNARGEVSHVVVSLEDVTEIHSRLQDNLAIQARLEKEIGLRKRMEVKLLERATIDFLTGIHNRRSFLGHLSKELRRAHRYGHALSLLLLDIDYFKAVNDAWGHQTGDTVLKLLVGLCAEEIRDVDTLGRMGGEEFGIVLPETVLEPARMVAERIAERVRRNILPKDSKAIIFTVSLGVAQAQPGQSLEEFMHQADQALYAAKRLGRDRVVAAGDETV